MATYTVANTGNALTNGNNLTNRLTNADGLGLLVGGDVVVLTAGAEYLGTSPGIQLPNLTLSIPVVIQSSSISSLPAGIRVQPVTFPLQRNLMPKITCQSGATAALWTADGANNWTLQGIEFRMSAFNMVNGHPAELFGLVWLGNNGVSGPYNVGQTALSQEPSNIKFDRCSFWSGFAGANNAVDGQEIRHGIQMHGSNITFTECDIRDFKSRTADAQAMNNLNGDGPWFLINSYVEGSTENVIWGGALPLIPNITYKPGSKVQYCWFRKPTYWNPLSYDYDGSIWAVKNIFELKNMNNTVFVNGTGQTTPGPSSILIDNNRFENSWQSVDQTGHAMLMTPRAGPSGQGASNDQIINVTVTNNYFLHCQRWFEIFSTDSEPPIVTNAGYPTTNITIKDNVVDDIWSWNNDPAPGYDGFNGPKPGNARNVWTLDVKSNFTGGTFVLTYNDLSLFSGGSSIAQPVSTGTIQWNANISTLATNVQTALNTLASVRGQAVCTGVGNIITINFQYATFGNLTINSLGLTGAGPAIVTPPHIGCGFLLPVINDSTTGAHAAGAGNVFRPTNLSGGSWAIQQGDVLVLDWDYRASGGTYNPSWEKVVVKAVTLDGGSPPNTVGNNAVGTFTCDTIKSHTTVGGLGQIPIGILQAQQSAPWTWYLDCGYKGTGGFDVAGATTAYGNATPFNTLTNITIQHNTVKPWAGVDYGYAGVIGGAGAFATGSSSSPQSKHTGIIINDNIFQMGTYLIKQGGDQGVSVGYGFRDTAGNTTNTGILQECDNSTQVRNNGFYRTAQSNINPAINGGIFTPPAGLSYSGLDPNLYYSDETGPKFVNYAAGGVGLALQPTSPLKGKATDGSDVGARNFVWLTDGNGTSNTGGGGGVVWNRINTCGFETGSAAEVLASVGGSENGVTGTASIQTVTTRTGVYALRCNPTTTAVGWCALTSPDTTGLGFISSGYDYATIYYRFYFLYKIKPAAANEEICFFFDKPGAHKGHLRLNSAGNIIAFDQSDTGVLATGATALQSNVWYRIEAKWGTGAAAAWEVKINGTTEISGTGNLGTSNNGWLGLGKHADRNGNSVDFYYDDVAIDTNQYPGPSQTIVLHPNAAGTFSQWTTGTGPSDYTQVNEAVPDGNTSYVQSSVNGNMFVVAFPTVESAGVGNIVYSVKAVCIAENAAGAAATQHLVVISGSTTKGLTDVDPGSAAGYREFANMMNTDPNTGSLWTFPALDILQVGMGNSSDNVARLTYVALMVEYQPSTAPPAPAPGLLLLTSYELGSFVVPLINTPSIAPSEGFLS